MTSHDCGWTRIRPEIDLSSSDLLRVRLLNVLSASHPHHVEVDLAAVTFLECGDITVLVVLARAARTGCRLQITNRNPVAAENSSGPLTWPFVSEPDRVARVV
jgi:anti-anti-sigma regulatory factor